jgi:hypothetical protein
LFSYRSPKPSAPDADGASAPIPRDLIYWSEGKCERTELLGLFIAYLVEHRWGITVDSGWSNWDVQVHYHPWTLLEVYTTQENHGAGKSLIRIRCRRRTTQLTKLVGVLAGAAALVLSGVHLAVGGAAAGVCGLLALAAWLRGRRLVAQALRGLDRLARGVQLIRCDATPKMGEQDGSSRTTVILAEAQQNTAVIAAEQARCGG